MAAPKDLLGQDLIVGDRVCVSVTNYNSAVMIVGNITKITEKTLIGNTKPSYSISVYNDYRSDDYFGLYTKIGKIIEYQSPKCMVKIP